MTLARITVARVIRSELAALEPAVGEGGIAFPNSEGRDGANAHDAGKPGTVGAEVRHAIRSLRVGRSEDDLARGVVPQNLDRALVLPVSPAPVRERMIEARHGLGGEHTERTEAPARIEERLLAVERVARDEAVELVRDIAEEREVLSSPRAVRIVEDGLEERRLQGNGDEVVEPVPGGLEKDERAGAVG